MSPVVTVLCHRTPVNSFCPFAPPVSLTHHHCHICASLFSASALVPVFTPLQRLAATLLTSVFMTVKVAVIYLFWDRDWLFGVDWPRAHYVTQVAFKFNKIHLSLPRAEITDMSIYGYLAFTFHTGVRIHGIYVSVSDLTPLTLCPLWFICIAANESSFLMVR